MLRKIAISFALLSLAIALCLAVGLSWLRSSNLPDRGGDRDEPVNLRILDSAVRVQRDRHAIPYIYAETLADAMRIQGYVTAQDRLSQILLTRELVNGRLAEQIGEAGVRSDILIRVMGLNRLGRTWAAQLESPSLELHEWYLQGVNAYMATREDEFPLAVRLFPEPPKPFTLEDLTAQYLFLAFNSTGNWRTELLSQALVDHLGAERAAEISMLTVNPDDGSEWASDYSLAANPVPLPWNNPGKEGFQPSTRTGCPRSQRVFPAHRRSGAPPPKLPASGAFPQLPEPQGGSNSWAMSGPRSAGGAPILANDPHIDARRLPGIWHPVGLITPQWRAVGAAGAGFPGLGVGRSDHIAWGVTNAYSDMARALETDPETRAAAGILRKWNYFDEPDLAAPALFQAMMRSLVMRIFEDELGAELARQYASDIYYWQERVQRKLLAGEWEWFDDRRTDEIEDRDSLFRAAARDAWIELQSRLGPDPEEWRWGDLSRLRFRNPWVPGDLADRLLGGGDFPGRGSGETLGRGRFPGLGNYDPRVIDSLRFVADLADQEKALAVVPGGVSSRLFDPHLNDQLPVWLSGEIGYWWFSDKAIAADTKQEMRFTP